MFRISIKIDLNVRKTSWKKIRFQLALGKTYSLTPPPLIHQRFKHHQRTKINKIFSTSSVLYAKFTITVLKSTQVFHSNSNWTWTTSVGALNWVWAVYATTDCEHKFQKMGRENWLPIGSNLTLTTARLFNHKWEVSEGLMYTSIKSRNNPGDILLSRHCASVIKSHTHHSE